MLKIGLLVTSRLLLLFLLRALWLVLIENGGRKVTEEDYETHGGLYEESHEIDGLDFEDGDR